MNRAQTEAVLHHEGPLLVLAGPGAGKTLVITHRVKALIERYGANPRKILVITFTKAAAEEMRQRFMKLMGGESSGVTFGTFHSVFFRILRHAYGYTADNIVREEQKQMFFREICDGLDYEVEDAKEFMQKLQAEISFVKGEGIDIAHYYSMNCPQEVFRKAYREYERKMIAKNLIDFDDMMLMCYELLTQRRDILSMWQQQYEYIQVDEVQDTNSIQYKLVRMLAAPQNNLALVGDDDQSIYQFRGAKPEILLGFPQDFPNGRQILLNVNYRSTKKIVEMAQRLISNNKKRFEKQIEAFQAEDCRDAVVTQGFPDVKSQNEAVLARIVRLHEKGMPYHKIAVLFRTNTQPRSLVELFMRCNLPFRMRDVLPNLYDHWITRDVLTYIAIALGNRERAGFLQIINRPKRYIARDCFSSATVSFDEMRAYYQDKDYVVERIDKLEADLRLIATFTPYAAIHYIWNVCGYEQYVKEYAAYRNIKPEELVELFDELLENAKPFKTYEEWFLHIEKLKKDLEQQAKDNRNTDKDAIAMMTYHSAKGLEFDTVFLIDVNEGMTPYKKALSDEELEEERRMFYVAFTRAKRQIFISWVKERYGKDCAVSRYVGELTISKQDFQVGAKVRHQVYGEGIVKKLSNGKITIRFTGQITDRILDLNYCIQNGILQKG